jgi:uncharacterized protein
VENNSLSNSSRGYQTSFAADAFPWPLTILAVVGAIVILSLVIIACGVAWVVSHGTDTAALTRALTGLYGVEIQSLAEAIVVLYLLLVVPVLARRSLRELGFRMPTSRDLLYTLIAIVSMFVLVTALGSLFESMLHVKAQEEAVHMFTKFHGFDRLLFAAFAVVVGPVTEEIFFRFMLFNAMRTWWGFAYGTVVSSILFGLAHMQQGGWAFNVSLVVPLAVGGLILCTVYDKTRNAWTNILTHACFNGLSLVAILVAPQLAK